MKANQVINGKYGRVWVNGEVYAEVKSFEAKVTGEFEDLTFCEDPGTHQKYLGYSGEGTMVLHKIRSRGGNLLGDAFKTGIMPEIKIVSRVADPAAIGHEKVELLEVTFSEFTLIKFEDKSVGEEELPFKFASYNYLDKIS